MQMTLLKLMTLTIVEATLMIIQIADHISLADTAII